MSYTNKITSALLAKTLLSSEDGGGAPSSEIPELGVILPKAAQSLRVSYREFALHLLDHYVCCDVIVTRDIDGDVYVGNVKRRLTTRQKSVKDTTLSD